MAAGRLPKLETVLRKLAAETVRQRKTLDERGETLAEHGELLGKINTGVKHILRTQLALTAAMTTAIRDVAQGRSIEICVKRFEDAVFGSKH